MGEEGGCGRVDSIKRVLRGTCKRQENSETEEG
jgi:hypothetical protein